MTSKPQKLVGSLPGWPSQGMHRAVDVGLVVQENALVELDDVVMVALADVVLTEVRLALDVIVDEADVILVVVLETVLEAFVQFAMSLAPCTLDAD